MTSQKTAKKKKRSYLNCSNFSFRSRYLLQMSQAFHRFQMKMKTKMTILDQELSQSAVGMYEKYLC